MIRFAVFWLVLYVFVCLPTVSVNAAIVDRNVAIVNQEAITLSEVDEIGKAYFQQIARNVPPAQQEAAIAQTRRQIIEKLIDQRLLLQEAKKYGITVTDAEVNGAVQRVLDNNKIDMQRFREELARIGMTERQYRNDLRDQLLGTKLINFEVRARVVIPENTIRSYYDNEYSEQQATGYHILQIGCVWDMPDRSGNVLNKAAAKVKAEKIRQMVMKGKDFRELAKLHSDMPSARNNGDLGTFGKEDMAPSMQEVISQLRQGEVSEIVEVENSFQFFKLLSSVTPDIPAVKPPYEEVKEKIQEKLYNEAMEKRFQTWIQGIRERAYIRVL